MMPQAEATGYLAPEEVEDLRCINDLPPQTFIEVKL
jgi:hypothetical protein